MNTKYRGFKLSWLMMFFLAGGFCLNAADLTNTTAVIQENWETISNRWGSVSSEKLRQAAENGDATAQYYLGCAYQDGNGITNDLSEAFKWEKLAADNGLVRAQKAVGSLYYSGTGVPQDYSSAAKYFLLAAENGNAPAQTSIGWLYANGLGVPQDFDEALKWFQKSANQGDSEAQDKIPWLSGKVFDYQYQMSKKYQKGDGVRKDAGEAFKWMKKAAESDYQSTEVNDALYKLGLIV